MTDNAIELTEQFRVFVNANTLIEQTLDKKYFHLFNNNNQSQVYSGFKSVDDLIGGFKNGELTTIAVRPGVGKTAFLLSLINNICVCGGRTSGVFSAERSAKKLFQRLVESSTGVPINKINTGKLTDVQKNVVLPVVKNLMNAKMFIDDTTNPMAEYIIEKSKLLVKAGVEILFIDYLELITTDMKSGDKNCDKEQLCIIVKVLKDLAVELNIPIVLFSQLSKPIVYNNRFKYTPDYINELSDTLLFLNRPDFYHINDIDGKEKGLAEITIAKSDNATDFIVANLRFVESLDKYTDC